MTAPVTVREHQHLTRPLEIKALDESARTFSGLAAAFALDLGGDVILPGAFKRTLKDWGAATKRRIIPLIDSHNRGSVRSVIGKLLDAAETEDGLTVTAEVIDGPDGDEVFRRLKGGYVDAMSIGYQTIQSKTPSPEEQRGGVWRFLQEVKLDEVSVVVFPMNPAARIDLSTVKSLLASGTPLTAEQVEELKAVATSIRALLDPAPSSSDAEPTGLAIEHPRRLAMAATYRALLLRGLGV